MHPDYDLTLSPPPLADYLRLRADSGLSPVTEAQGEPPLVNSWAWVHVRHRASGEVVAMGRVIGDGGWYFHVIDMAVLPPHQGRGIGSAVLRALLDHIHRDAPPGAYVSLMADEPGRPLYERHVFADPAPRTIGMSLSMDRGGHD